MTPKKYLNKVAYKTSIEIIPGEKSEVYQSKFDDSYITHVGMENDIRHLAKREITEELTHGVGFSPKDNKWYGWSHRAIYGFGIGSSCKKGDCHYRPTDANDFLDDMIRFWSEESRVNVSGEHAIDEGGNGVQISWEYATDEKLIPNSKVHGQISGCFQPYPDQWGQGEWIAQTMEDAKQMAMDFNEGVS